MLDDVVSSFPSYATDYSYTPFAKSDGSQFGLDCGLVKGGLYGAHELVDKLERAGFFEGARHPDSDLDAMVYTLTRDNPVTMFDGAGMSVSEDGHFMLTIDTHRNEGEVAAALENVVAQLNEDDARRKAQRQKELDDIKKDADRESHPPVFSMKQDFEFVSRYLKRRVLAEFPGSAPKVEKAESLDGLHYQELSGICRNALAVSFEHPEGENYARFNDFHLSLGRVFTGFCAIFPDTDDTTDSVQVTGNTPRLAADIVENDPDGAIAVIAEMGLTHLPELVRENCDTGKLAVQRSRRRGANIPRLKR